MPIDFNDHARWLAVRDAVYASAFYQDAYHLATRAEMTDAGIAARARSSAEYAVELFERQHSEPVVIAAPTAEPEEVDAEPFVDAYRRWINAGDGALASGKVCEIVAENGIAPHCHVREIAGGYEFRFAVEPVPPRYAKRDVVFCAYTSGKATTGGPECSARADVRTLLASLGFEVKS